MGAGDVCSSDLIDDLTTRPGGIIIRKVVSDDGAGHVALEDDDGGADVTPYTVTPDGLLNTRPLGDVPAGAAYIAGAILEYATPLYPVGATRTHVRSGPWGEDLDGDGIGESFRFEYTQVFLGFETMQLSTTVTLNDVAHFRNVIRLFLRGTRSADRSIAFTEEAWFAPGLGLVRAQRVAVDEIGALVDAPHTLVFAGRLGPVRASSRARRVVRRCSSQAQHFGLRRRAQRVLRKRSRIGREQRQPDRHHRPGDRPALLFEDRRTGARCPCHLRRRERAIR